MLSLLRFQKLLSQKMIGTGSCHQAYRQCRCYCYGDGAVLLTNRFLSRYAPSSSSSNNIITAIPTPSVTTTTTYRFQSSSSQDSTTGSITYSGGQASVGQGGFYGSGGARSLSPDHTADGEDDSVTQEQNKQRSKMLAMAHDVQNVRITMQELELLESLLRNEEESHQSSSSSSTTTLSSKSMEIKNSIKKLMTSTTFLESLSNLEVHGEPTWGLNCEEREMIILAREKVNAC